MKYIKANELKVGDEFRYNGIWLKVGGVVVGVNKVAIEIDDSGSGAYANSRMFEYDGINIEILIKDREPQPKPPETPPRLRWQIKFSTCNGVVAASLICEDRKFPNRYGSWHETEEKALASLASVLGREIEARSR